MATFTVELYRVAELRGTIGLDEYPIFDEEYRDGLNKKIFDHYADQEIGMESVPRFLHAMRRRMNEIMPKYNQLYESEKLVIDPLNTISMSTLANALGTQKATNAATSATTNGSKTDSVEKRDSSTDTDASAVGQTVQSNFPQTQLQQRKDYASAGTDTTNKSKTVADGKETNTGTATTTGTGTADDKSTTDLQSTDKSDGTVKGWQGSQAMLLMQFRATFLNIDMDIINELADLFMFVWTNGDQLSPSRNGIYYP